MATKLRTRLDLQEVLCEILGSNNAYYQPPETVKMKYPAIVYSRYDFENFHANNDVYMRSPAYQLTVIDKNPDSEIVEKVSKLPLCSFDRHYKADNLNHDVFTIYLQ